MGLEDAIHPVTAIVVLEGRLPGCLSTPMITAGEAMGLASELWTDLTVET